MERLQSPWNIVVPVALGVAFALGVMLLIVTLTGPHDPNATTTTALADTTTTAAPETTTTTEPATTTTAETTTTAADVDFADDFDEVLNTEITGNPGPSLTDIRFGAHPGYARIVFDLTGSGTPMYHVRYEDPPFYTDGEGAEVEINGSAFLVVTMSPVSSYDTESEEFELVYTGDRELYPGLDPIVEVINTGDFEAQMTWIIGLTGQKGFRVQILQDPLRIVIDIAS
ncbi:MAG: hypothetical protein WEA29_02580 [Acidimicrobiia bacterium]